MRITLLCWGLLIGLISQGQSGKNTVTLYGYCRESTPGAHIGFMNEKGESEKIIPPQNIRSWFFYVEVPAKTVLKPLYLLVNQEKITVMAEPVKHTPVLLERPGILNKVETDTLVPLSSQTVYRLLPVTATAVNAEQPTVQFIYSIQQKIKKTPIVPIRMLPPLVLE